MINDYFSIGKIVASHGLAGDVVLEHALGKTDLKGLETLFVEETKGNFLPYFIEHTKLKNESEIFVKLEGVNTKESGRTTNQR